MVNQQQLQEEKSPSVPKSGTSEGQGSSTQVDSNAKWYVIHVQTGYEARVKTALEQRIKSLGVENKIFEVVIPMRDIVIVKKGKKTKANEKVFPGYVLIMMILGWLSELQRE